MIFYKDFKKEQPFLIIPRSSVIQINKHQIDKTDLYKFSIYYQLSKDKPITELKLKTQSRSETEQWITRLKKTIRPQKYVFEYTHLNEEEYTTPSDIVHVNDIRNFYLQLCHIEYIIARHYIRKLLDNLCTIAEKEKSKHTSNVCMKSDYLSSVTNQALNVTNPLNSGYIGSNFNNVGIEEIKEEVTQNTNTNNNVDGITMAIEEEKVIGISCMEEDNGGDIKNDNDDGVVVDQGKSGNDGENEKEDKDEVEVSSQTEKADMRFKNECLLDPELVKLTVGEQENEEEIGNKTSPVEQK